MAVIAGAQFADEEPRLADIAKQAVVRFFRARTEQGPSRAAGQPVTCMELERQFDTVNLIAARSHLGAAELSEKRSPVVRHPEDTISG